MVRQSLSYFATLRGVFEGGFQAQEHKPAVKYGGVSIMLSGCFAGSGMDTFHKTNGIMKKEDFTSN